MVVAKMTIYDLKIIPSIRALLRNFKLLLLAPREFIYSSVFTTQKRIKILPYNPMVTQVGNKLINQIHENLPELKIHFFGSAALKIAGQKDIDLFAECDPADFPRFEPILIKILGKPAKHRSNFIEWNLKKNDCAVEFVLISPQSSIFQLQLKTHIRLKNDPQMLRAYEKLKLESNNLTEREYNIRRLEFFNKAGL